MNPALSPAESHALAESHHQVRHGPPLVLSLFPGIDLLGRAFREEGYCVVRGPDLLWGEAIEDWHVPAGRFDGIIGGPPCVNYSDLNRNRNPAEGDRLVTEFLRVVWEARPAWFLMENVRNVPSVLIRDYRAQRIDLRDDHCGGVTRRLRHVQFGSRDGSIIRPTRTPRPRSVTPGRALSTREDGPGDRWCRRLRKAGVTELELPALKPSARRAAVGNAVPMCMGRVLARAVTARGPVTPLDCICGCGRVCDRPGLQATDACRQRLCRRRAGLPRTLTLEV